MAKWDTEPTPSELRAPRPADEHPVRHTRRRPTRHWCQGKVGVEHTLDIRVQRGVASQRTQPHKFGREDYRPLGRGGMSCGWTWWLWRLYGGDWHYNCVHERYCTTCGKIYPLERTACPEYDQHPKPTTSAREVEAKARQERETAQALRRPRR